ncbi:MAG: putative Holliday junction resolvase [Actinomycetota bacterium]|jgi:putative Holliday junction resolvase
MTGPATSGRRLALDPGAERIGIAISDESCLLAAPIGTFEAARLEEKLSEILEKYAIGAIYIGLPIHLSGVEGASAIAARDLANKIAKTFQIPTSLVDERLTTKSANDNYEAIKRYGVDAMAACEILDFALSGEKSLGKIFGSVIEV